MKRAPATLAKPRRLAFPLAAVLLLPLVLSASLLAQQVSLTLFPEETPWNEPVTATIEGTGCSGAVNAPELGVVNGKHVVDIALLGCHAGDPSPFSVEIPLGPLYPASFTVRVLDAARPGSAPLATRPLVARYAAQLALGLPQVATDDAPLTITTFVPWASPCSYLDGPFVRDRIVELRFDPACPILPPGPAPLLRDEISVGPLAAGVWDVRFYEWTNQGGPNNLALVRRTLRVHAAAGCVPSPTALCLAGDRFRVEVAWTDFAGGAGVGRPRPLTADGASGLFWFFSADNVELTVKALDGCGVNGHWWVFLSSGSTVEYTVTVTDTATGRQRTYANPEGFSAPLVSDTAAFACGG